MKKSQVKVDNKQHNNQTPNSVYASNNTFMFTKTKAHTQEFNARIRKYSKNITSKPQEQMQIIIIRRRGIIIIHLWLQNLEPILSNSMPNSAKWKKNKTNKPREEIQKKKEKKSSIDKNSKKQLSALTWTRP